MVDLIELETERLRLRQWRAEDREPFAALNADPEVMAFFPSTLDRCASDAIADRCEALIARRGWGFWALEAKEGGRFIGFVGLHAPELELPFSPCVEIGWRLAHAYWGRGLATEAARAALRVGFERIGLAEIVSFTAVINARSRGVMQRLGMQPSSATFEHPAVPLGSPLREHVLYRLSRESWLRSL
ncbi:GNAT family N-acetyltransferase [Thiorhodococcus fuscus]|uniref:GNAT family N-acetyltransferase n=1 Tax=Thiorhodococcus fuscus TaxID=527200 RepID=A0ABW4Y6T9_9GAMM